MGTAIRAWNERQDHLLPELGLEKERFILCVFRFLSARALSAIMEKCLLQLTIISNPRYDLRITFFANSSRKCKKQLSGLCSARMLLYRSYAIKKLLCSRFLLSRCDIDFMAVKSSFSHLRP